MVRFITSEERRDRRDVAVQDLAKISTPTEFPPENPTEEEIQRHTDMCVENWKKILGPELAAVEKMALAQGVTLRATAEVFVREWFNQKVRVI
jgi:hypothetical protein